MRRVRVGPFVLVAFLAGSWFLSYRSQETDEEKAERLANAPEVACEALLRDSRRSDGEEEYREVDEHYTPDDLQYVRDLSKHAMAVLDGTTHPDAQAVLRYLEEDENASAAVRQTGDIGVVEDMIPVIHGLRDRAVRACTDLGHPEWEEYLRTRDRGG